MSDKLIEAVESELYGTPEKKTNLPEVNNVTEKTSFQKLTDGAEDLYSEQKKELTPEKLEWRKAGVKPVNFTMYDKKLEKLQSYGGKFMKYGYNPYINNETFYDDMTTNMEQWQRSFIGMGKLAKIAVTDNALFGSFSGKDSHLDHKKVTDFYTSSKGGATGFMQNLVLNAGYTVGIMADMMLEEFALAGITALTLGASSGLTSTAMAGKAASSMKKIKQGWDMYGDLQKTMRAADKIKKTSLLNNKAARFLNPIGNTSTFIKNLKNAETLKDLSSGGKIITGTGELFRDAKGIHLAFTEAELEGNMLKDELFDELVANHQGPLSASDAKRYKEQSEAASFWAKSENMVAIGATNKLVFNNMFKAFDDLKGLGKTMAEHKYHKMVRAKDGTKVVRKGMSGTGERSKMLFSKGFTKGLGTKAKTIAGKSGTYFSSNLGEGVQELAQETIHGTNKHAYGSEAQGDYWDSILHGLKEQFTGQGAETFLSGFLMGSVISPINFTVKQVTNIKDGGYRAFTDRTKYKADISAERNRLEADAKLIDELYQNPGDVIKSMGNGLASQSDSEEEMLDAVADNDQHRFKNAKETAYREHLSALMRHDMMDQFVDHLEEMKTMDAQQFGEAFPLVGSKTTEAKRNQIINSRIERAQQFEEHYNNIQKHVVNPVNLSRLDKNDPNYESAVLYHHYFEQAKNELIFANAEMQDNIKRKASILDKIKSDLKGNTLGDIALMEYEKLYSAEGINKELHALRAEVVTLDYDDITAEEKKELKNKKNKYEALVRFGESLNEMQEVEDSLAELNSLPESDITPKDKKEIKRLNNQLSQATTRLFNRHNDYLKVLAPKVKGVAFTNASEKSFKALHDTFKLDARAKELDFLSNVLANENMMHEFVTEKVRDNKIYMNQFKQYVRNSLAKSRNSKVVQDGMNKLYAEGIGFNMSELDKLVEEGIVPEKFYDLETGELIPAKISIKNKNGEVTGEENNERYDLAVSIATNIYDNQLDKPKKESKPEVKNEIIDEETGEVITVEEDYVPTEEDDIPVDDITDVNSFPPIILNELISDYKEAVKNEDISDTQTNLEELAPGNLSASFITWAQDNPKTEDLLENHNDRVNTDVPTTLESLSNEEKGSLKDLGYSEGQVNALSKVDVERVLENQITPEEFKPEAQEETEEDVPKVVENGPETFDSELQEEDQNGQYRRKRAMNLINDALKQEPGSKDDSAFFNVVTAVEKVVLPKLGDKIGDYEITEEVLKDIYNIFKGLPNIELNTLEQFSNNADYQIYELNNPEALKKKEQEAQDKIDNLRKLGYTKKDIDGLQENERNRILENGIEKLDYVDPVNKNKSIEVKEIKALIKEQYSGKIKTKDQYIEAVSEFALNNSELYEEHEAFVLAEFNKITKAVAKAKGFNNVAEGDVVQMKDGSLRKVTKVLKTRVHLVNYNNIIQDQVVMSKSQFNKENTRIVNDFNKDDKNLVSDLEKQNINDLSSLLSTFTGGALMSSDKVPTEEELRDNFICK